MAAKRAVAATGFTGGSERAHINPMSILKIARMGHPVLRAKAQAVADPTAPEIHRLITDMAETLADIGGAGLAAPQVHVPLRVVIFRVPQERLTGRPDDQAQDLTAIINPVIEPQGDEREVGWEGSKRSVARKPLA